MKISKQILLLSGGIASGFLAGYLTSTYLRPNQFLEHKKKIEEAISRFSKVLKESQIRLQEVNRRMKKEIIHPIPDLYRATESLSLDENELIYD
jgi:hypothetical protein